jgi:hypothetical protein
LHASPIFAKKKKKTGAATHKRREKSHRRPPSRPGGERKKMGARTPNQRDTATRIEKKQTYNVGGTPL